MPISTHWFLPFQIALLHQNITHLSDIWEARLLVIQKCWVLVPKWWIFFFFSLFFFLLTWQIISSTRTSKKILYPLPCSVNLPHKLGQALQTMAAEPTERAVLAREQGEDERVVFVPRDCFLGPDPAVYQGSFKCLWKRSLQNVLWRA